MKYSFPIIRFGDRQQNQTMRGVALELKGSIRYEETDMGPWVEANAPGADDDYETFSTVEGEDVEKLVIELIKDKFPGQVEFRDYLELKNIKYNFSSW